MAHLADHRILDRDEVAAGDHVGVGEDVGSGIRGGDRHVGGNATLFDFDRGQRRCPRGDNAVDLVVVFRTVGKLGEARVGDEVVALHRAAQAREVRVGACDYAHVFAVGGGVVVERGAVRQAIALAVANDSKFVVARERPLENAEHTAVQRGVDDHSVSTPLGSRLALQGTPVTRIPGVERGTRGLGREYSGEVIGDRDAYPYRRPIGVSGEVHQTAVADADAVEAGAFAVRAVLAEHRDPHDD